MPPGKLAASRGIRLEATDGNVGQIEESLVDPDTDYITHIVMLEGRGRGMKGISLPTPAIDRVMGDTPHLKLDKAAIDMIPAIPVHRRHAAGDEKHKRISFVARVSEGKDETAKELEYIETLHREPMIRILNAAVLARKQRGTPHLTDTRGLQSKRSHLFGALAGELVGLRWEPVGVVIDALAGLGAGNLASKHIDRAFRTIF